MGKSNLVFSQKMALSTPPREKLTFVKLINLDVTSARSYSPDRCLPIFHASPASQSIQFGAAAVWLAVLVNADGKPSPRAPAPR